MNKYTIYHSTDGVLATGKPYPTDEGAEIPNLDPSLSLLLEVTEAKPTYDSATHKLVKDEVNYNTIDKTSAHQHTLRSGASSMTPRRHHRTHSPA
jgi:hypothetical protein